MKANEFKMMRRKNLGNYEHEEVTISMTVEDDDNLDSVIEFTQVKIAEALGLQPKVENIKEVLDERKLLKRLLRKRSLKRKLLNQREPMFQMIPKKKLTLH